jgi:hypothetical protein
MGLLRYFQPCTPSLACAEASIRHQMISEQVLSILATDNLDVACAAIEKAAMERAVSDVDEGFAASYEARRRHREVSCS